MNENDILNIPEENVLITDAQSDLELDLIENDMVVAQNGEQISLDVDGDGIIAPDTDGRLIVRYLFGLTGQSLISDAIGVGAVRNSASQIITYLNEFGNTLLDVDGNGRLGALSDGILTLRFLSGFTGENLTRGAIDSDATRIVANDIEAHLESFNTPTPISNTLVSILATDATATEPLLGIDTGTFTVVRSGGDITQPISVNYIVDGTAENGIDYESLEGTVIISAEEVEAEIPLFPVDDSLVEGIETVNITLIDGDNYIVEPSANIAEIEIEDVDLQIPQEVITFEAPSITQVSETTWEMELQGSDGSRFISTIVNTGTQLYQEVIRYIPGSSDDQSYTVTFNSEGTSMEVEFDGDSQRLIAERNNDDFVRLNRISNDGSMTNIVDIPVDPELLEDDSDLINITDPLTRALCEAGQQFCKNVEIFGDVLGGLSALATATGVAVIPGGVLGAGSLASRVASIGCLVLLGDDEKLTETGLDLVSGAFSRLGGDLLTSASRNVRQGVVNGLMNFAGNQADEIVDFLVDETGSKIGEKTFDFISSSLNLQENIESELSNQGGLMREFRRQLGIDFCDENDDIAPPIEDPIASFEVTCDGGDECTIGSGETANLQISYTNPNNNTNRIEITGSNILPVLGRTINVPEERKGGGTLNFTLEHRGAFGGTCSSFDGFVQVAIFTDNGLVFGLDTIDINLIGDPNGIIPCNHTIV